MQRAFAHSRPALMLRRLRSRFGVSAPRVTVRAHIPWHWRLVAILVLLAVAVALAGGGYVTGRSFAGDDRNMAEQELSTLRMRVETLETEAERLRGIGNGSEASLQIERTAQLKLGEQVKRLEAENGRLREDLAAFENLAAGETKNQTISIHRGQVEPDPTAGANAYRYRFLLAAPVSPRPEREFKGRIQLVATILQDGKPAILSIPDATAPDAQKFLVSFKYFRRIEGNFSLPANAVLKKLEVRLMQGVAAVASQPLTM